MRITLTVILLFHGYTAYLQSDLPAYAKLISQENLTVDLTKLASNEFMGRETGKEGQHKAAEYIEQSFIKNGLQQMPGLNGWQQYFQVTESQPEGKLIADGKILTFRTDFFYLDSRRTQIQTQVPVTVSLDDPGVLVKKLKGMDIRAEIKELKKQPHSAIILLTDNYKDLAEYFDHNLNSSTMRLVDGPKKEEVPVLIVNGDRNAALFSKYIRFDESTGLGKLKSKKALTISYELNTRTEILTSSNVLGFIPGSDSVLSRELVVITAHYDHIGVIDGEVYNGADDDGSGTVAVMEIARVFAQAWKDGHGPRRSMLFMLVSGEEKGLLGSSYYTSHPLWPLSETVTDLNIDMIGRRDIAHENSDSYIYVIGSDMLSTELHQLNERANQSIANIDLDYRFNSTSDPNQFYYRSDHYNFAKNNIPSIFYFSGVHEDYHQATDDVEKIDFAKTRHITQLVFATAWFVGNADHRPVVDKKSSN